MVMPVHRRVSEQPVKHIVSGGKLVAHCLMMGCLLASPKKQMKQHRQFSFALSVRCTWFPMWILPVSLIAFKAFIMACITLSAFILKKVSIFEKKNVFLHRDIAVIFFVLHRKITKN